jgi:hypothetical protein
VPSAISVTSLVISFIVLAKTSYFYGHSLVYKRLKMMDLPLGTLDIGASLDVKRTEACILPDSEMSSPHHQITLHPQTTPYAHAHRQTDTHTQTTSPPPHTHTNTDRDIKVLFTQMAKLQYDVAILQNEVNSRANDVEQI